MKIPSYFTSCIANIHAFHAFHACVRWFSHGYHWKYRWHIKYKYWDKLLDWISWKWASWKYNYRTYASKYFRKQLAECMHKYQSTSTFYRYTAYIWELYCVSGCILLLLDFESGIQYIYCMRTYKKNPSSINAIPNLPSMHSMCFTEQLEITSAKTI